MTLQPKTETLISRAVEQWKQLKAKTSPDKRESYSTSFTHPLGVAHWDNPNLLWLYITSNEESYEGSQTQIGLTRDGKLRWEFQSHCSCDGYEDSAGNGEEMPEDSKKSYEFMEVPKEWEIIIQANLEKLLQSDNEPTK
jgi:hypothetical protein